MLGSLRQVEIAYVRLPSGLEITVGYDVKDELESQKGAWRAVQGFAIANNPNFDPLSVDDRTVEYKRYNPNFAPGVPAENQSAAKAFSYHKSVEIDGEDRLKWLYGPIGNYKKTDFEFGEKSPDKETDDWSFLNRRPKEMVAFRGKIK